MTNEILTLRLDDVHPDPEQPRQHFDREAMERLKGAILAVGQLQPIRVRRTGDGYMIVDGQRRWLALSALAKTNPDEGRFHQIRAFIGDELDEERSSRRVVQVLSNIGEDLSPTEKAAALAEIMAGDTSASTEELGRRIGVAASQVQFLRQLNAAPEFVRELGTGSDALPLWNLITLVRLHRKLSKWDREQFRDTEGQHQRIADSEVKRLGRRAQERAWGKRKLQQEAERVLERVTGKAGKSEGGDRVAALRRVLANVEALEASMQAEIAELLQGVLEKLSGRGKRRTRARTTN